MPNNAFDSRNASQARDALKQSVIYACCTETRAAACCRAAAASITLGEFQVAAGYLELAAGVADEDGEIMLWILARMCRLRVMLAEDEDWEMKDIIAADLDRLHEQSDKFEHVSAFVVMELMLGLAEFSLKMTLVPEFKPNDTYLRGLRDSMEAILNSEDSVELLSEQWLAAYAVMSMIAVVMGEPRKADSYVTRATEYRNGIGAEAV